MGRAFNKLAQTYFFGLMFCYITLCIWCLNHPRLSLPRAFTHRQASLSTKRPRASVPRKCLSFLRGLTEILPLMWNILWSPPTLEAELIKELRITVFSFYLSYRVSPAALWSFWPSLRAPWEKGLCPTHHYPSLKELVFHALQKILFWFYSFLTGAAI